MQGSYGGRIEHVSIRVLPDGRMTRSDAARYLGLRPKTLAMWMMLGKGPASTKVGGRVFYFQRDLDEFVARSQTASSR